LSRAEGMASSFSQRSEPWFCLNLLCSLDFFFGTFFCIKAKESTLRNQPARKPVQAQ
jgi:hypothetical protein